MSYTATTALPQLMSYEDSYKTNNA